MATLVLVLMILSGILFIGSVFLMTPKGGIGFGIWGMATSNEYGSKKSVESTLKKTAIISIVFFTACALVYPYLNKANLSTGMKVSQPQNQSANVKLSPENLKIETVKSKPVEIKTQTQQTSETNK